MSQLVFVGTSDAFGAGGRRQAAIWLRAAGGSVLIDCGTTTASGLAQLGIARDELDCVLISHFHGDHFAGIPQLLLAALYEDRRTRELRIAGPRGLEARVRALAAAMGYGLSEREWSFPIRFQELPSGREAEVGPVRVHSFETLHQAETQPHGFLISTGRERIAYSGDTGWFDDLPERVGDADLFICECTYRSEGFGLHLSHERLSAHRDEFDCGRLLLTHLGSAMHAIRQKLDFDVADDGLVVDL
jgi:ribonuclease BN (tRNA processing enzyme)